MEGSCSASSMPLRAALAFTFLSLLLEEVTDSDRHDFLGIVHSDFYDDITRTYVCGKKIYISLCLASEYKLCRNSILPAWNWKYGWHSVQELGPALLTNQLDDEAAKVIFSLLSHTEFISFLKLILDAFHLPLGWSQKQNDDTPHFAHSSFYCPTIVIE